MPHLFAPYTSVNSWSPINIVFERSVPSTPGGYKSGPGFWKKRLANLVDFPAREAVEKFIRTTGIQGMEKVEQELEAKGWVAEVGFDEQNLRAQFQVFQEGKLEFIYEIRLRAYAMPEIGRASCRERV